MGHDKVANMTIQLLNLVQLPKFYAETKDGLPAVGYLVWTFEAGTSTLCNTYKDPAGAALNTNPIVLDAWGEATVYANILIKVVFTAPGGDPSAPLWSTDYVGEQPDSTIRCASNPVPVANNYIVNPIPAVITLTEGMTLVMTSDTSSIATLVAPQTFAGTGVGGAGRGINDGVFTGPYVGTTDGSVFNATIDSLSAPIDSYIKLLLHGDGSGATIVDSSLDPKTVTVNGDVTQSAAQSKFGGKSILFDGTGDYLSLADSADWFLGTGDFSIEGWWRFTALQDATFFSQYADANNRFHLDYVNSTHKIRFYYRDSSTDRADYDYTWTPTVDTWYHIMLERSAGILTLFIDGVPVTWTTATTPITSATSLGDIAGLLTIGYNEYVTIGTYFKGYLDEFAWAKGVARHTISTFDVPTQAYSTTSADTFKWRKDGETWVEKVPIQEHAVLQILKENIGITFAEVFGHSLNDSWSVTVRTPVRINLSGLGNKLVYKNVGGTLVTLAGGDIYEDIPATLVYSVTGACWILNNPSTAAAETPALALRTRKELVADYQMTILDAGNEMSCLGTFVVTLPLAPVGANRFYYVKNKGSGAITIDAQGYGIYGYGLSGQTTFTLARNVEAVQLATNGVDWHVLSIVVGPLIPGGESYYTAGSFDWVCPVGVTAIYISLVGGGGGGGGGGGAADIGAFGGSPGVVSPVSLGTFNTQIVVPGTTYTVVVGPGGNGNKGPGVAGGASEFKEGVSVLQTAAGGAGGIYPYTSGSREGGTNGTGHGSGGLGRGYPESPQQAGDPGQPGSVVFTY